MQYKIFLFFLSLNVLNALQIETKEEPFRSLLKDIITKKNIDYTKINEADRNVALRNIQEIKKAVEQIKPLFAPSIDANLDSILLYTGKASQELNDALKNPQHGSQEISLKELFVHIRQQSPLNLSNVSVDSLNKTLRQVLLLKALLFYFKFYGGSTAILDNLTTLENNLENKGGVAQKETLQPLPQRPAIKPQPMPQAPIPKMPTQVPVIQPQSIFPVRPAAKVVPAPIPVPKPVAMPSPMPEKVIQPLPAPTPLIIPPQPAVVEKPAERVEKPVALVPNDYKTVAQIDLGNNRKLIQLPTVDQTRGMLAKTYGGATCPALSLFNAINIVEYGLSGEAKYLNALANDQEATKFFTQTFENCADIKQFNSLTIEQVRAIKVPVSVKNYINVLDSVILLRDPIEGEGEDAAMNASIYHKLQDGLRKNNFVQALILGNTEMHMKGGQHYITFAILKSGNHIQYIVTDTLHDFNHLAHDKFREQILYLINTIEKGFTPARRSSYMAVLEGKQQAPEGQSLDLKDLINIYKDINEVPLGFIELKNLPHLKTTIQSIKANKTQFNKLAQELNISPEQLENILSVFEIEINALLATTSKTSLNLNRPCKGASIALKKRGRRAVRA